MNQPTLIYDFDATSNLKDWQIVNDGVMGGVSNSRIDLTPNHHAKFSGHVSLENYGGFASVMLRTSVDIQTEQKFIVLKVKGDGKTYQFRLKGSARQSHSYIQSFSTNGQWQTIKLPLQKFEPSFRGRRLDLPNFNFSTIEEVRFLIGNKKEEDFELLIDSISLD
jgi:hypothetical protein